MVSNGVAAGSGEAGTADAVGNGETGTVGSGEADAADNGEVGTAGSDEAETEGSDEAQTPGGDEGETEGSDGEETADSGEEETVPGSLEGLLQQGDIEAVISDSVTGDGTQGHALPWPWMLLAAVLLAILAAGLALLLGKRKKKETAASAGPEPGGEAAPESPRQTVTVTQELRRTAPASVRAVGKVHHIGRRQAQQDSLGVTDYGDGILAVVADGMGGLADGDKVSQKIVLTMLQDGSSLAGNHVEGALYRMLAHANREVNSMLGVSEQYKSGSTVVAVTVQAGGFSWVSVGDSRIYLYRGHHLFQVNREHVHEADLWKKAVRGDISFSEVAKDPQRKHVSSFVGMGELRHIDGSIRPMPVYPGDKLLLMSDGVFNTLSEQEICDVLRREGEAPGAARALESLVLARQNLRQDNFTAVILDIC